MSTTFIHLCVYLRFTRHQNHILMRHKFSSVSLVQHCPFSFSGTTLPFQFLWYNTALLVSLVQHCPFSFSGTTLPFQFLWYNTALSVSLVQHCSFSFSGTTLPFPSIKQLCVRQQEHLKVKDANDVKLPTIRFIRTVLINVHVTLCPLVSLPTFRNTDVTFLSKAKQCQKVGVLCIKLTESGI